MKMSKRVPCVWLLTAAAMIPISMPAQTTSGQPSTTEMQQPSGSQSKAAGFLKTAARENDLEISLAEIGVEKAQNQELKSFCQQLQQEHLRLDKQLKPLAQAYGVRLDQKIPHKATKEEMKLHKLSGSEFDQTLAKSLLQTHQRSIHSFEKALQQKQPADVEEFAQNTLPKLEQHMQEAKNVARTVGVDQATISSLGSQTPEAMGGTGSSPESDLGVGAGKKTERGAGAKQLEGNNPPGQQ